MDYRAALVDFYRKHNPLKLVEVDALLRKYRGREEELLHALRVKYKVNEQGESIEETPPAPPPPPKERPTPRMEAIRNHTPREEPRIEAPREEPTWDEPAPRMEAIRNEPSEETYQQETYREETPAEEPRPRRDAEITRTVNDYTNDYKGNTAAERAAYWRKELEKREQERRERKKDDGTTPPREKRKEEPVQKTKSKPEPKVDKMKVVREAEVETEGEDTEVQEVKKNSRVKIAIIVIAGVLLVLAVITALFNDTVRGKIGLADTPEQVSAEDKAKKTGLDPAVMTNTEDSARTGEFALEGDETEERVPSVEDAMNEQSSSSSKEAARPSREQRTAREEESREPAAPAGEVVRKKYYIGCAAVANKETAETMASELRRKGFDNAGYFYIPDYDPAGKDLYRIYVGPFESVESAEETAVNVRAESPSAYTFFLK